MVKRYYVTSNTYRIRLGNGQTANGVGLGESEVETEKGKWVKYEDHQQIVTNLMGMIDGLINSQSALMNNMFFCKACMRQVEELKN